MEQMTCGTQNSPLKYHNHSLDQSSPCAESCQLCWCFDNVCSLGNKLEKPKLGHYFFTISNHHSKLLAKCTPCSSLRKVNDFPSCCLCTLTCIGMLEILDAAVRSVITQSLTLHASFCPGINMLP